LFILYIFFFIKLPLGPKIVVAITKMCDETGTVYLFEGQVYGSLHFANDPGQLSLSFEVPVVIIHLGDNGNDEEGKDNTDHVKNI